MDTHAIALSCREVVSATADGLRWTADPRNAHIVLQERPRIERVLRRTAAEAKRLEETLKRPTCVGIFGPSQAGKSFLVSVLARRPGSETMMAKFAGATPELDYIRDVNPQGGEETTGLVTRFTVHPCPSPEGFPVCLRLLSQIDVIKILINSFFQDGDQESETASDVDDLERHIVGFERRAAASPVDAMSEDDMWDVYEYMSKNASGSSIATALERVWDRIAFLAPRLQIADRVEFLSVLWNRHARYSAMFSELADALKRLGFASEAFCELGSLMPANEGILCVKTLEGFLVDGVTSIAVTTMQGSPVRLPKPTVTALAAELRIVCRDAPHAMFETTDMLDFPGYRNREKRRLSTYFESAPMATKDLFLRGKVDYLFQSYTANLELTSLILCIPDSNQEVPSLAKAVDHWIAVTHGDTPEKRVGKPVMFFFALTKFDRHFSETANDEGKPSALRFEIRLSASLLEPFGKVSTSWPRQWTPDRPFDNLFCIRNPNFKSEHIINYSGRTEISFIPERMERISMLREAFVGSSILRTHIRETERAWDEVMTLNDGGVGYLSSALGVFSRPDLKTNQVWARLAEIRQEADAVLRRHYVDDDSVKRRAARLEIVDGTIFPDLDRCLEMRAFGTALRGLMVDASGLYGALVDSLGRSDAAPVQRGVVTSILGNGGARQARSDRWDKVAAAALTYWNDSMGKRVDDPAFSRRVGLGRESLKEIVAEIGAAARRIDLTSRIAKILRERTTPNEKADAAARRGCMVAERIVNRFVAQLDFDTKSEHVQRQEFADDLFDPIFVSRPTRFDTTQMPSERPDYVRDFIIDWAKGFRAVVAVNALQLSAGGRDPHQNARLGAILQQLAA